ncbi:ATP-dependent DNA ligase [Terriglobus saanensis]|uniref:DNA ligase n=1 Tax=Terriglobus saanensis (strain ATCC BAA-1853 / DSM 23119 / SP1PR4) TaxID=401053 RepID=E8V3M5_TERSS|nr:ATP-dependent DNA ligase [Terriglobus saanensis]ADV84712.1 DNA ligase I, ATP-dependent Dnl1 [Terriglobus saanensis SP1PR4]
MALFLQLAELADVLAATSSRLKKRAAIAEGITAVHAQSPEEAGLFALYLAGQTFPEADPRKLNAGGAVLSRIIASISHAADTAMTEAYRRHGDLGAATHDLFLDAGHNPPPTLTFTDLHDAFAQASIARTTVIRQIVLTDLLTRAIPVEAKYLIKLMLGDMRIGVKQSLVEEAIAVAAEASLSDVRNAVMLQADLACATEMAFAKTLREARMRLFHPLGFMLASPVETPEEAVERFAKIPVESDASTPPPTHVEPDPPSVSEDAYTVTAQEEISPEAIHIHAQIEDKYDGMRVQLHCGDPAQPGRVALYSRNREDVTESYPEIAEAFAHAESGAMILDGELLAWDVQQERALPFAVLSPRIGRKRVSNEVRTATPVVFMAFDVLYASDSLLLDLPLRERRNRLEAIAERLLAVTHSPLALPATADTGLFAHDNGAAQTGVQRLLLSPISLAYSAEDLDRAYNAARERGNEGVMIKAADSIYQPGRRGISWVKLKRQLGTLDVVITGAEYGHGKRSQFLSDYTFAIRAPEGDLLNVGKAYSGVTDAEIVKLTAWLKDHTLEDQGHFRTVEPGIVLEVAFNNVMRSSRHASGFALRFPRILRIRTDKPLEEIDTLERVEEIYQSQPDKPAEA